MTLLYQHRLGARGCLDSHLHSQEPSLYQGTPEWFALNRQTEEFHFKTHLNLEIPSLRIGNHLVVCVHSVLISFSCSVLAQLQFYFLFFSLHLSNAVWHTLLYYKPHFAINRG